ARRSGSSRPRSSWCCERCPPGRPRRKSWTRSARCSVKATTELPDDPALPGLRAIRAVGLAGALPALELDERPVEVALRGYTPGRWRGGRPSRPGKLGPPVGAADMVCNAGKEVVQLDAADHGLGAAARRLARMLTRTLPKNGPRRLVHGTFYARHVLDQGDGV